MTSYDEDGTESKDVKQAGADRKIKNGHFVRRGPRFNNDLIGAGCLRKESLEIYNTQNPEILFDDSVATICK